MKLLRSASAGAKVRQDLMVVLHPAEAGVHIIIESTVQSLFEAAIRSAAEDVLSRYQIEHCQVEIYDFGALDFVVKARVETAVRRAIEGDTI